jgi:polyketide synthase PksJ
MAEMDTNNMVKGKLDRSNVQDIFELNSVQKGMLFHYLKETDQNLYSVQLSFSIEGVFYIDVLRNAAQIVIAENEVLRSVFNWDKVSKPLQIILKEWSPELAYHDVSGNNAAVIAELVQSYSDQDWNARFDLNHPPLRMQVIRTSDKSFVFNLTYHHILYDGWSNGILLKELFDCYNRLAENKQPVLSHKPAYKTVYKALRQRTHGDATMQYWKNYLKEHIGGSLLFRDQGDSTNKGVATKQPFTTPLTGLEAFAAEHKLTVASVIYAAHAVLLYKYLKADDVVFGTTVSDRDTTIAGIDKMIGNFINTIPLRLTGFEERTLMQVVQETYRNIIDRDQFNGVSYADIKQLLDLPPSDNLYDSVIAIENYPLDDAAINSSSQFNISLRAVQENTSIPLVITVFLKGELGIELMYREIAMNQVFAKTFAQNFIAIINEIVTNSNKKANEVSLLLNEEEIEWLKKQNNTQVNYPKEKTIISLFDEQVARTPNNVALSIGDVTVSYKELKDRSEKIASFLRQEKGIGKGDFVALMLEREAYLVPFILGVLRAGAAYVPIDPQYPAERINAIIEDAKPKLVIARDTCDPIINYSGSVVHENITSTDLAYVLYTSGSTGKPKGVMIGHRSLVNYITWAAGQYVGESKATFPLFTSISFDLTVTSIFTPLITGNKIVIYKEDTKSMLIENVIGNADVDVIKCTPSHLKILRDSQQLELPAGNQIRKFIVGGEDFPAQLAHDITERFAGRVEIYNEYGPTEATVGCMIHKFDAKDGFASVPVGHPIDNTRIYILDELLRQVPAGVHGELYIAGDGLAKGYLNKEELTKASFIANPFAENERMYKTGDVAIRCFDGSILYKGRTDDQVKIRGYRIEPGEITNLILEYENVKDAVVLTRERSGEKYLVAYVSGRFEKPDTYTTNLREYLSKKLPAYAVPSFFVALKEMPVNANGKLDKKALPEPEFEMQAPEEFVAASGEVEEKLLQVWSQVLGYDKISTNINFFDAGGNSIKLISLGGKINRAFNTRITVNDLFEHPSISKFARFISERNKVAEEVVAAPEEPVKQEEVIKPTDIAIIGMSCRFPGANNVDAFWNNLRGGKESITREDQPGDAALVSAKGMLEGYELFDASFFGYLPTEAGTMDPQMRIFHECVWEGIEHAGYNPSAYEGRIGLYGGASPNPYYNIEAGEEGEDMFEKWAALSYADKDFICQRVSYKLNLKGPSISLSTACSTSLVAVDMACNDLLNGKCDIAVAGGVSVTLHDNKGYRYHKGMILSADGRCRAFDESAGGTVGGNGAGVVVLKKLEDAIRDGDEIHGVIKGTAINNDGSEKVGFTAPGIEGQSRVIAGALAGAGIDAESISYVEAHGTGTALGDPVEIAGLSRAFSTNKKQYCAIGSVKTNIGHLDAAAGIAGLIKTVLCLKHKQLVPSLHYTKANANIDFANSPFYVNVELKEWKNDKYPRRAGVSSFGIGGTNAHVIVQEAPVLQEVPPATGDYQLLLLSGRTTTALQANRNNLVEYLRQNENVKLADIAYTLQTGRAHFEYRQAVVCKDHAEAIERLNTSGAAPDPVNAGHKQQVVFMFSGQGSQYANMCRDLYEKEDAFKQTVDECFNIIQQISGKDLAPIIFHQRTENGELDNTEYTQPALFVMEYALARLMMNWRVQPSIMIGHSIGEYVAACISGVFSLEDALRLVVRRGELMQQAPRGVMLSISISEKQLRSILADHSTISLAAVNSSELCVVSGEAKAINEFKELMEQKGFTCKLVRTSHAFHSWMMDGILQEFRETAARVSFKAPKLPFVSNVTGQLATEAQVCNADYWTTHLRREVKFSQGIESILEKGNALFIETGPGHALATFVRSNKQRRKEHKVVNLVRPAAQQSNDVSYLLKGIGELWQHGISIHFKNEKRKRIALPAYAFDRLAFPVMLNPQKAAENLLVRENDISEWFYAPAWKSVPVIAGNEQWNAGDRYLSFADNAGIAEIINRSLQQKNISCIIVTPGEKYVEKNANSYEINPESAADYQHLFDTLSQKNILPDNIIYTWSIDRVQPADQKITTLINYDPDLYRLFHIAKAVADKVSAKLHFTLVTNELYSLTGSEQVSVNASSLTGLLTVMSQEYTGFSAGSIDVSLDEVDMRGFAALLMNAVHHKQNGSVVALRNGRRFHRYFEKIYNNTHAAPAIKKGGVYLITGGSGEMALTLGRYLLRQYQAKLILLGRSPLPAESEWPHYLENGQSASVTAKRIRRMQELRQYGEVLYLPCDVADENALRDAVANAENKFGIINGVVHAAGVVGGRSVDVISRLNEKDLEEQFRPKMTGLYNLATVLGNRELDFCLVASSISAMLGGLRFGAYAPVNLAMDHYINLQRENGRCNNWVSVNFDGIAYEDAQGEGIKTIELYEVFERLVLSVDQPQLVVSVADLEQRLRRWVFTKKVANAADDAQAISIGSADNVEQQLLSLWSAFFGKNDITPDDNFFDLGGDSLKVLTMIARMQKRFNVEVSVSEFFEEPTVRALSNRICSSGKIKNDKQVYAAIRPAEPRMYYPLSSVQRRMYFLYELDRSSTAYNMPLALRVEGKLDKNRLTDVFTKLIARHEILRSAFEVVNGVPQQRVMPDFDFEIEYYASNDNAEELAQSFIRPFDLSLAPLIRVGLIKITANEHILLVDLPHIVSDGVSKNILIGDFMSLYNNEALPQLQLQYRDYATWQQTEAYEEEINRQQQFWINEFPDGAGVLELPADFARPLIKSYDGHTINFDIDAEQAKKLKQVAEAEGTTMFMLLLTAYNVLLARLSNQEDIVVGTFVSGRHRTELESIMGMFVNTLALRNYPRAEMNFRELLTEVKSKTLAAFDNQSYPYEMLIDVLKVPRDTSRNPLFEAMFSYENIEKRSLQIPGLTISPFNAENTVSKFDLTLTAFEHGSELTFAFEYSTRLFKKETIKRFISYFNNILSGIIANIETKISSIDILTKEEQHRLLHEFNNTAGDYPKNETIVSLFENRALATPDKVAVVYENRQLTYAELNKQSNQLANYLRTHHDIKPNDTIGIMFERSEQMLVVLLGILKSGAAFIPIDPAYPKERIEYILEDTGAQLLLVSKAVDNDLRYTGKVIQVDAATVSSYSHENIAHTVSPQHLCYLIYTSGSTGKPKGVMIAHSNVVNFFEGLNNRITVREDDSLLAVTSTSFDISVLELFWTLCRGIQVVIHHADISLGGLNRYMPGENTAMDFSLFFFSSYNAGKKDKYELLLETVKYADQQGFKAVWTPERHFHEFGGLFPNPSVISSALAMVTKQIELRSGSIVSPLHDTLRIAEEWSVVDNLSNGRVGLSFASGWNPNDFVLSGNSYKNRHAVMYDQIDEVKKLWKGESIKRINGAGQEAEIRMFPSPVQSDLPVWVTAAGSEETFMKAGAIGANILTHFLGQDMEQLARKIKLYREARAQHGHDANTGKVSIMLHTYVGEDREEIEKVVEQPFTEYLRSSIGLAKIMFEETGSNDEDLSEEIKSKLLRNAFRRYYTTGSLIGTKASCERMVRKLKEIGVDEIACLIDFGVEEPKVMEGLKHLKELKDLFSGSAINLQKPVSMMQSTPSFIKQVADDSGSEKFLRSLRTLLVGGEAVPLSLVNEIKRNYKAEVYNMYGPTETTIWSCMHRFDASTAKVSVGKPMLNTQVYVLNKTLQLLPVGVPGDIYIGGEGVSQGYWNRPQLTAERFISNPFRENESIYRTGDVGRWLPDGTIELTGREDHQVKIKGYRIELGEIETELLKFEGVREAVVVARHDKQAEKYLAAYIVSAAADQNALRAFLGKTLPYYMIPSRFIHLEQMPLTPNGKINRNALPDPATEGEAYTYMAPTNEVQEKLATIWSDILRLEKDSIGVNRSFFELGGHSLKATALVNQVHKYFKVDVPIKEIFNKQTIESLADYLITVKQIEYTTETVDNSIEIAL